MQQWRTYRRLQIADEICNYIQYHAPMAKEKTVYVCSDCGGNSPKWLGKCPACNAWNTLIESVADNPSAVKNRFAELLPEITAWRRDLHENPEILFETHRTSAVVAEKLKEFGCDEIVTGTDIYGGTWRLFNRVLAERGIAVKAVNTADIPADGAPGTALTDTVSLRRT